MSIPKDSVSVTAYNTFMDQEREDLRATMNHWRSEVEKLPKNERQEGLAFVSKLGGAAYELINNQTSYGTDLVEIRKLFKEATNQINFTMREVYAPKIEAAQRFNWILPHAQITASKEENPSHYGIDLKSGMDETDLRFARMNMTLATRPATYRQYHCTMAVSQCVLLEKGKAPDIAVQAWDNDEVATCHYITHEKNASGFLVPVGARVTGTEDPAVCTALFLAAGKEPGIERANEKKHEELNAMYMNHMLFQ